MMQFYALDVRCIGIFYDNGRCSMAKFLTPRQAKAKANRAKAIEARRAGTTQIGPVHESAVAESDLPKC